MIRVECYGIAGIVRNESHKKPMSKPNLLLWGHLWGHLPGIFLGGNETCEIWELKMHLKYGIFAQKVFLLSIRFWFHREAFDGHSFLLHSEASNAGRPWHHISSSQSLLVGFLNEASMKLSLKQLEDTVPENNQIPDDTSLLPAETLSGCSGFRGRNVGR